MKVRKTFGLKSLFLLFSFSLIFSGCKDEEGNKKGFNLFSLQDDITFGAQVAAEIESDSETYPILDSATYSEAYEHLYRVRDTILNSGLVQYGEEFAWRCRIIGDDSTLNAFCTPGGYIYVYTGLIKYLEDEASFAGVLGHEIAHADERHSTEALSKQYGTEVLFSILLGEDQGTLAQVAKGMLGLRYSRANESESDRKSVDYLYPTGYDARGAAKFFEKLLDSGAGSGPEFLSTHPNPDNRVEAINEYWSTKGGKEGEDFVERYKQFKASLP